MSRVSVKTMLKDALTNKYAVGYFESWSLESTLAMVRAAENMKSPIMIGVCGTYVGEPKRKYKESVAVYQAMLAEIAHEAKVPVALLLNEADDEQLVLDAAAVGFDMVMFAPIFASEALPLDELTKIQKRIAKRAHEMDVLVEGEVGELPLFNSATGELHEGEVTDPKVCEDFVKETGVDTIAVAVGNCHLKEDGLVTIDFEALKTLVERIEIPLVLHGGTSISHEDLSKAASMGVAKVNFGTGMKRVALTAMKEYFAKNDVDKMDPNDVLGRGQEKDLMVIEQEAIMKYVEATIKALNGENKAF
ncbi:class II fructose-bisphosphate aldolase [Ohessyouella blattaphilus]|uniref:Class II fructose-bisphosphate aldolase n=1 Tax=Ohessyouella blattaphilus TaxID=2949333 RepID=A0ABT1EDZ5_9FIRM|nr:class II fructose-bisphosphate aldolase [Ohessyouella blattaphilus]MCP1108929.1 class II fructose-bisphosphate aldolase [Ohessyouella blattaphilus]MCR8562323.1 class II fructose-bisphosphate aldolase [Ohessyouella blattaphilus]MDL2249020.1 class II fructose-bisphosphate aldolase [Lachnospiraceae bacterium OttesenSCG-928-J05]